MVKISSKRGTSTINAADVKNWAGETFKNFQKEQLKVCWFGYRSITEKRY